MWLTLCDVDAEIEKRFEVYMGAAEAAEAEALRASMTTVVATRKELSRTATFRE